jgi:hypothetical protein
LGKTKAIQTKIKTSGPRTLFDFNQRKSKEIKGGTLGTLRPPSPRYFPKPPGYKASRSGACQLKQNINISTACVAMAGNGKKWQGRPDWGKIAKLKLFKALPVQSNERF